MRSQVKFPAIYHNGLDAFDRGRKLSDNPYPDDAARHESWKQGWLQGFKIDRHDRNEYEQEKRT